MNIRQVISDYIAKSVLTTVGDLVIRGAGGPERLATGIIGQILAAKGAGILPAWEDELMLNAANGAFYELKHKTTLLTGLSGDPVFWVDAIPAGSLIIGVTSRVITALTGTTDPRYSLGVVGTNYIWATTAASALGTTTDIANFAIASPVYYTALTDLQVKCNLGTFTGGDLRLVLHYIDLTPPTA